MMARREWGKPLAVVGCCALLLSTCKGDPVTATKVATGAAAAGAGIGAGAAGGAAAGGAVKGLGKRVERKVAGVPNGPSRPMPTTIPPFTQGFDIKVQP